MKEIAAIIKNMLAATRPAAVVEGPHKGKPSKANYVTEEGVLKQCRDRIRKLLAGFPVYPNLDLELLQRHFRT